VNDPVKRIDFLLKRDSVSKKSCLRPTSSLRLLGTDPADLASSDLSVQELNERRRLGVFEAKSLLWASDHFGLLINVNITRCTL
jgi:hypothetical protein